MKKWNNFTMVICVVSVISVLLASSPFAEAQQAERRIRDNIQTFMMLRMTQALDLSEEQAAKIFPKMNQVEKKKSALHRELGRLRIELRVILDRDQPDEQKIVEKIQEIRRLRQQLREEDEEYEAFLDANLSLVQRAQYILFTQEFFKLMRERLNKARSYQENRKRD